MSHIGHSKVLASYKLSASSIQHIICFFYFFEIADMLSSTVSRRLGVLHRLFLVQNPTAATTRVPSAAVAMAALGKETEVHHDPEKRTFFVSLPNGNASCSAHVCNSYSKVCLENEILFLSSYLL